MNANSTSRYAGVDALRGLIMMIMAIDHASAMIARQHASEFWAGAMSAYSSAFPFLTRWITHLCAPGFFFLMGAGIYWYSAKQREPAVSRTVWRGLVLLLCGLFLESPLIFVQSKLKPPTVSLNTVVAPPPMDGSAFYWAVITLSGLGLTMMVCALLLRMRPWAWVLISALCVIATNSFLPASGMPGPWWQAMLLTPGLSQHLLIVYPVIPWLAVASAGMYFGYWWRRNPELASQRVWMVGAGFLATGILLRAAGGWGNIRLPRDGGWIEFLNNVKYPPSLVFWTMSVGLNLILLWVLIRLPKPFTSDRSPLMVFGQTPLFFYLLHFYLFIAMGFAFFREPASLEFTYVMWAVALVLLYPVCSMYRRWKFSKSPESIWRMF